MPTKYNQRQRKLLVQKCRAVRHFKLLDKTGLGQTTVDVLYRYLEEMRPKMGNLSWVSQETLATYVGCKRNAVAQAVAILLEIGALTKIASSADAVRDLLHRRFGYKLLTNQMCVNLVTFNPNWEGFQKDTSCLSDETKDLVKALRQKNSRWHKLLEKHATLEEEGWAGPIVEPEEPQLDYGNLDPEVVSQALQEGPSDDEIDAIMDEICARGSDQEVVSQALQEGNAAEPAADAGVGCIAGATGTLPLRVRGVESAAKPTLHCSPVELPEEEDLNHASVNAQAPRSTAKRGFDACGVSPPQALELSLAGVGPPTGLDLHPAQRDSRFDLAELKANLHRSRRTPNTQPEPVLALPWSSDGSARPDGRPDAQTPPRAQESRAAVVPVAYEDEGIDSFEEMLAKEMMKP